jgi:hypothetical protein
VIARPARADSLLLLVLGLIWGTSYAFIKLGVQTLPTFPSVDLLRSSAPDPSAPHAARHRCSDGVSTTT